jgi:3-hydroxyacyl-[acyl-carrier-protein] dehydratase
VILMRWMWIDRIVEHAPGERMVAVKGVSLSEGHLYDHFPGADGRKAMPVMPATLILEGCAQTGGLLAGHAERFKQKVLLAKIARANLDREAAPGQALRYTANLMRLDDFGAHTTIDIDLFPEPGGEPVRIGSAEIVFSHADQNRSGLELPEENFVFGDTFTTLLESSGVEIPE